MKQYLITFLSVISAAISLRAQQQELPGVRLSLQQCVETAINNNLDVLQSELQMQTAKTNWNQARLNQLPDLGLSTSSGINQGRSIDPFSNAYSNETINYSNYGLNSGVILFNGGALKNTVRQNELGYQAARMDWQQSKDNITINIILAYLDVLRSEDLLKQSLQQAELSLRQVERLNIMNQEGAITPSDLFDLKGQYANDQLAIITATNSVGNAKVSLCKLMNVIYRKDIELERLDNAEFAGAYAGSPEEVYAETLKEFAQVQSVEFRKQSAARAVKAFRGSLFPTLSLNGALGSNYSSAARNNVFLNNSFEATSDYVMVNGTQSPVIVQKSNFDAQKIGYTRQLNNNLSNSINLSLRVPIFGNWQARNRIRLAEVQLKNAEYIQNTTLTQLQQSVEQAHLNLVTASNRYTTLGEQVAAYRELFRAAEIRFNEGVGNSIDYLLAKNKLDQANINTIVARYDYVLRSKVLDYYRGRKLW